MLADISVLVILLLPIGELASSPKNPYRSGLTFYFVSVCYCIIVCALSMLCFVHYNLDFDCWDSASLRSTASPAAAHLLGRHLHAALRFSPVTACRNDNSLINASVGKTNVFEFHYCHFKRESLRGAAALQRASLPGGGGFTWTELIHGKKTVLHEKLICNQLLWFEHWLLLRTSVLACSGICLVVRLSLGILFLAPVLTFVVSRATSVVSDRHILYVSARLLFTIFFRGDKISRCWSDEIWFRNRCVSPQGEFSELWWSAHGSSSATIRSIFTFQRAKLRWWKILHTPKWCGWLPLELWGKEPAPPPASLRQRPNSKTTWSH